MNNNLKSYLDKINSLVQSSTVTSNLLEMDLLLDYTRKLYEEIYVTRLRVEQQFIKTKQLDIQADLEVLAPVLEMPLVNDEEPQDIAIDLQHIVVEENAKEQHVEPLDMNSFPVNSAGANEAHKEHTILEETATAQESVIDFSTFNATEVSVDNATVAPEDNDEVKIEASVAETSAVIVDEEPERLNEEPLPMISPAPILEVEEPQPTLPQTKEIEKSTIGATDIEPEIYQPHVLKYDALLDAAQEEDTVEKDDISIEDNNPIEESATSAEISNTPSKEDNSTDDYLNTFLNSKELLTDDFIDKLLNSNATKEPVAPARPSISKYIGINDRYQFMNELFNNDKQKFEDTLNKIAAKSSFTAAEQFIKDELITQMKWNREDATYLNLVSVVKRYFSENI